MAINVNENGVIKDLSSISITGFDISSIEYVGEMIENPEGQSGYTPMATVELPDLFESYKAFILIYNGMSNYTNPNKYVTVLIAIVSAMIDRFNSSQGDYYRYFMLESYSSAPQFLSVLYSSVGTKTIKFYDGTSYGKYKVYAVR